MAKKKAEINRDWARGVPPNGIMQQGNPVLEERACTVGMQQGKFSDQVTHFCHDLVTKMRDLNAQGLAAPQVGMPVQIAVIETRPIAVWRESIKRSRLYVMINPVIVKRFGGMHRDWEGCFSIPGRWGKVPRYRRVTVEYFDLKGKKQRRDFTDYLARVVQHEVDHLSGMEYTRRMGPNSRLLSLEERQKMHSQ